MTRRGFTLVELMLALTLTAITATVAGSALVSARRTAERVREHGSATADDSRWRAMLADMLRHPPRPDQASEPLLRLNREGSTSSLQFLTVGVREPLGTGSIWRAVVTEDSAGLLLTASPITAGASDPIVQYRLADAQLVNITVLEPATARDAARWRIDWPIAQQRPAAIAIEWRTAGPSGSGARPPLVQSLDPLGSAFEGTIGVATSGGALP
ncbi:type II secretion system protein J [Gemmatimonas sp.]|jgi:prepilin-type N-terminal cleavage/methylation domain-containing protein|uniref:type II secretion system protein J n=2 Tax=Gemmatimonas sp. TaxID=1962908 RepID=UPI0037BE9D85